jgi:hypothetical protein
MRWTAIRAACGLITVGILILSTPSVGAQTAGREPVAGAPLESGVTFVDLDHPATSSGELRLWRVLSTEGARVMLKVFRPEADRLLLVGTSSLETVPAGGVTTFACNIPVARNDLIGCFCPDSSCADSFADGRTLTAAGDVGTSPNSAFISEIGSPSISAAGSLMADVPSVAAADLVLPVVGRTAGLSGTLWRTGLELFNTAATETEVAVFLNLSDIDNTTPAASAQLTIPPRDTLVVDDLIADAFALDEAVGSVDIVASAPIIAHARIANFGSDVGTFGQAVPGLPASWAVADEELPGLNPNGGLVYLFEAVQDEAFRTNLGIASVVAAPLVVEVTARAGGQSVGTPLTLTLPPFSHTQVNRVLNEMGVPPGTEGVRLEAAAAPGSNGRFFAYISRVDNGSGDAVFLLGDREAVLP